MANLFVFFSLSRARLCLHRTAAEGNINDVLIKTLAEAHANTNPKLEFVHEMFRKPQVNLTSNFCSTQSVILHLSMKYSINLIHFFCCCCSLSGSISNSSLQEHGPRGIVVGLCGKINDNDTKYH